MADTNTVPSVDQAFGQKTPTVDEAFGPEQQQRPISGNFADWFFSNSSLGRVMSAFGQGAEQGWGETQLDLPKEQVQTLKKANIFNDYTKSGATLTKALNEMAVRPFVNTAYNVATGAFASTAQEIGKQLEESATGIKQNVPVVGPYLAAPIGEAGEIIGSIPEGSLGAELPEVHAPETNDLARARAAGNVGEGEQGYFNTVPVSDENIVARQQAAKEAGLQETPAPKAPQTDIHAVVRQAYPDLFKQFDGLMQLEDNLHDSIDYVRSKATADTQREIDVLEARSNGDIINLTDDDQKRLNNYRQQLEDIQNADSPEIRDLRDRLIDTQFQLANLIPDVSRAYQHAEDIMAIPEELGAKEAAPGKQPAIVGEQPTPTEGQPITAPEKPVQGNPDLPPIQVAPEEEPILEGQKLASVEGTGPARERGLSSGIQAGAVQKGLVDNFGDLPEYRQISMQDQAAKATDLLHAHPDQALDIAMGRQPAPTGILPESILVAVEKDAATRGDIETLRQLALGSRLATEATTMGQRIRALAERDSTDPVALMRAVQDARKKALAKKGKTTEAETAQIMNQIKQAVKQNVPKQEDWANFLKSIECDY